MNNGTIIRIRREVSTSEESEPEPEEPEPEPEPKPEPEPEVEPEDPLDVEERQLKEQLMMSLTLTLVDEENIRQRLLEIKKTRLRKNTTTLGKNLVEKFLGDADVTLFENLQTPNRQEEERILTEK